MKDKVHQDGLTSGGFDPTRVDDRTELKPWFSVSVVLNRVFLRGPCWIHLCSMQTCFPLFSPAALRTNSVVIGSRQKAGSNPSQRILHSLSHRVFLRNTSKIRSFLTFTCFYCITLNCCNSPTTNVGLGLLDRSGTCLPLSSTWILGQRSSEGSAAESVTRRELLLILFEFLTSL